jgi:hypothetical protein
MTDSVLEYRAALARNRDTFLIEHGRLLKAFSCILENFELMFERLSTARDLSGKSQISLIPFVALLQRQVTAAFEAFASFQSFHGWVIIRPGIEAALVVGKFVDDRKFFQIWMNRITDRKAYRNSFTGSALVSKSLPSSASIQAVLSTVNDDFVHANPEYYNRHLELTEGGTDHLNIAVTYFDDSANNLAHTLAFLHLALIIQESLAGLLTRLYGQPLKLRFSAGGFRTDFRKDIETAVSKVPNGRSIIEKLGLVNKGATTTTAQNEQT